MLTADQILKLQAKEYKELQSKRNKKRRGRRKKNDLTLDKLSIIKKKMAIKNLPKYTSKSDPAFILGFDLASDKPQKRGRLIYVGPGSAYVEYEIDDVRVVKNKKGEEREQPFKRPERQHISKETKIYPLKE
jgi:hypothetical protein